MKSVDPIFIILASVVGLIVLPLVLHFPLLLYRLVKVRRIAKKDGPFFAPFILLLLLNGWVIITVASPFIPRPRSFNYFMSENGDRNYEAAINLRSIGTYEFEYHDEHNIYAGREGINGSGAFADLEWKPNGNTTYAYYVGKDYLAPTQPGHELEFSPDTNWPITIKPEASDHGFTAVAIGNIDSDRFLDIWMINDTGEPRHLVNDYYNTDEPGVCVQCPCVNRYTWAEKTRCVANPILDQLFAALGVLSFLFILLSPLMIIVIPLTYYLAIRQNRLYRTAMEEYETVDSSAEGGGAGN
jgi:hypothetical protein